MVDPLTESSSWQSRKASVRSESGALVSESDMLTATLTIVDWCIS